jgi:cysteinyl-tRNA synthetase
VLKIYNTLARTKQEFVPISPGRVRMYVCGMTVYDYCHLGHARVMVAFDLVRRWLRASGLAVTYVRNITDIDDKIIKRAQENKEPVEALTARFIEAMTEDADALGVERPDAEPKATDHVAGMLDMIGTLEKKGLAYKAANGDVNYSVRKFPEYGKLSGKSLDDLRAGERVEIGAGKQDPLDFVLWKKWKEGEPGWDSSWGRGRPGWHIECSAMSSALLGEHFDIHGGGQDLQFPHHENEIAQSEGASQSKFVNYWMHNGFVRVDNEKMSKSLGNFFTVREILKQYDPEVVRFFIARAHYRSPLNYSDQHLDDARQALTSLYTALRGVEPESIDVDWSRMTMPSSSEEVNKLPFENIELIKFKSAMDDDFNTPEAVAVLFNLANQVNKFKSPRTAGFLKKLGGILGLLQRDPNNFLQGVPNTYRHVGSGGTTDGGSAEVDSIPAGLTKGINQLISERNAARKAKNFAEADRIRKELADAGIVLEDGPKGTIWRRS